MLRRRDKNCEAGQGLACPFDFALCTPPGLNVVCAAGLVPASGGIVWGAGGWECRPCWEGASLFKLSLQPRLPAAERHGAGLGSRWVSRGCLGLGRAHSSWFLTARVSQELVTPRVAPLEGTWDCSTWLKGFHHARWHLPAQNHCTQAEIPALVCCLSEQVLSSCCPCSSHLGRPELFVPRALCAFLATPCPRQSILWVPYLFQQKFTFIKPPICWRWVLVLCPFLPSHCPARGSLRCSVGTSIPACGCHHPCPHFPLRRDKRSALPCLFRFPH